MQIRRKLRSSGRMTAFLLCLFFAAYRQGLTQNQTVTPAFLKKPFRADAATRTFAQYAKMLREQCGISLIADGIPLKENAELEFDGTAKAALNRIADAFDFTWTTKSGIVLMNKRFKSKEERPQINLPEMRQMTKEIVEAFHSIKYNADPQQWKPMLQTLAQSFTREQAQTLLEGQTLQATQLAPQQRELLTQAIYTMTFARPLPAWEMLLYRLENISNSYLLAKPRIEQSEGDEPQIPFDLFYVSKDKNGKLLSETIPYSLQPKE